MLFWDTKLLPSTPLVEKLSQRGRLRVVVECIDDLRSPFEAIFSSHLTEHGRIFFVRAFALILQASQISEIRPEQAKPILGLARWVEDAPPAIWDMAMSVVHLLERAGTQLTANDVLHCLSYAYQFVLQVEVLLKLDHAIGEAELVEREKASRACVVCISRQLEHIAQALREDGGDGCG